MKQFNFVDLTLCLFGAPACYAATTAACTADECVSGIEYTNPVK